MINFKSMMVIAPHPDDEVIGCGGAMLKYSEVEKHTLIIFDRTYNHVVTPDFVQRDSAIAKSIANDCGGDVSFLHFHGESDCNLLVTIADAIERELDNLKPDVLFVSIPSIHQDHELVFHATRIANRKVKIPNVILYFSGPISVHGADYSRPNLFVDLSLEQAKKKVSFMERYESELRWPQNSSFLMETMSYFGQSINSTFAEHFVMFNVVG